VTQVFQGPVATTVVRGEKPSIEKLKAEKAGWEKWKLESARCKVQSAKCKVNAGLVLDRRGRHQPTYPRLVSLAFKSLYRREKRRSTVRDQTEKKAV